MILAPDSESLREYNTCHAPDSGRFCSKDVELEHTIFDYHHGQHDGAVIARDGYGVQVGRLDYSLYNGLLRVGMIEVDPKRRREGIGTSMLARLRQEYPKEGLDPGYRTPDGEPFWQATKHLVRPPKKARAPKPAGWPVRRRGKYLLEANDCHTPAGSPQGGQFCSKGGATVRRWHLTDNPHFVADPTRKPTLNRTFLSDILADEKDLPAGVFVTDADGVEYWKHAHGYERPYVAELEGTLAPPMPGGARMAHEDLMQGDVRTVRVLTLDEFAREHYGSMGWVEADNSDLPYHQQPKFKNYTARPVSDMTAAERKRWERQFKAYTKRSR